MSIFNRLKQKLKSIFLPTTKEVLKRNDDGFNDDGFKVHTVVSGETLSHLALKYYGNAMEYDRIFQANRDILYNPDKIYVGQVLRIPEKD